jgi:hypothetical protein
MKVLQTSALATWLRRPENKRCEIAGMRSPANIAQAIKYEKWGGKSSPKEEPSTLRVGYSEKAALFGQPGGSAVLSMQ